MSLILFVLSEIKFNSELTVYSMTSSVSPPTVTLDMVLSEIDVSRSMLVSFGSLISSEPVVELGSMVYCW